MANEKNPLYNKYRKRFVEIKKGRHIQDAVLAKNLSIMKKYGASDGVIDKWVHGYRNVPAIGALAIIAFTLQTSCSYLVAQHDMASFAIDSSSIDVTMNDINDLHKDYLGYTIYMNSHITPSWVNAKRKTGITPMDQARPYMKVSNEIGVRLDYLLGLTKYINEKEYAYQSGCDVQALGGSLLYRLENEEYGIVSSDGTSVVLKDGEMKSLEDFRSEGAKLVRKIVL